MVSPTGRGIRNDTEGSGAYGSSRGSRKHNGVDYLCVTGQDIVAPFDMFIARVSYPKKDHILSGVKWVSGKSEGRMFYFEPDQDVIGAHVKAGEIIGTAQSVATYYGLSKMKDHLHFQINR